MTFTLRRLSPSALRTWDECALRWRWRNDRVPEPDPPYAGFMLGRMVHAGLEHAHRYAREVNAPVAGAELMDVVNSVLDLSTEQGREARRRVLTYLAHAGSIDGSSIIDVERWLEMPGEDVVGRADLIRRAPSDGGVEVVDFKTGRLRGSDLVGWQADIYLAAAYLDPGIVAAGDVTFTIEALGKDRVDVRSRTITQTQAEELVRSVRSAVAHRRDQILSDPHEPTVGPWCRMCPYASYCPAMNGEPPDGVYRPEWPT